MRATRSGAQRSIDAKQCYPLDTRTMARPASMSQAVVSRIWRAFGLRPHLPDTFKLSSNSSGVKKVPGSSGLHLAPPDHALMPCVDEKPQNQPSQRMAGIPSQAEPPTHDYHRHRIIDLFVDFDVRAGQVNGACERHHRSTEFGAFLDRVKHSVPARLEVQLVLHDPKAHRSVASRLVV